MTILEREISRRKFLKGAGAMSVAVAGIAVVGCGEVVGDLKDSRDFEKLEGVRETLKITQKFGSYDVIVRSDADLSDDSKMGITAPGIALIVTEGRGVTYPDSEYNRGIVDYKGEKRGVWYLVNEVPLYERIGDELFPRKDKYGNQIIAKNAIIAENFLRTPTEEEINRIADTAAGNK